MVNVLWTWLTTDLRNLQSESSSWAFAAKVLKVALMMKWFCLFVFLNLSTATAFFLLLLKWCFSYILKLVFLFICQNNYNPSYHLLGRLLQFPFSLVASNTPDLCLVLYFVSNVSFMPFSYVFSHNHSKPFNFYSKCWIILVPFIISQFLLDSSIIPRLLLWTFSNWIVPKIVLVQICLILTKALT